MTPLEARRNTPNIIRILVRAMFDDIDLAGRDAQWVDRDSFDCGVLSVARWLLQRADQIEAGDA